MTSTVDYTTLELKDGHTIDLVSFQRTPGRVAYSEPIQLEYDSGPIKIQIDFSLEQARELRDALQRGLDHIAEGGDE